MSRNITLRPRLNEKTYGLSERRVYVFDVEKEVNKHSIARAVESQFEVKVLEVNTAVAKGKTKRVVSVSGKRYTNSQGKRSDVKKAYVTLAEGQSLPFFEAIEEEEQQEQATQEKFDKAAAKQAEKEAKKDKKSETRKPEAEKEAKTRGPDSETPPKVKKTAGPKAEKAEEPIKEEPKKRTPLAWRGWRLRKKNRADDEEDK
jgi:large subunit ribosomal protein L23